ncbi:ABC transporter ATP-binding protein [Oceanobacillus jordanicus]|uniref:ABC transporter ATP-binding protein n=1 Tax=Oceanobacillus jordanicus TaxID=2867266 RepID=A0AAW5B9B3_9BACI|nr:ABC transporter ATP-binding protein [Oceanobacillus jordanicus]MCG3421030.1 ABC transporter ATP-binding protein [Oceanobacillus jordanicus]
MTKDILSISKVEKSYAGKEVLGSISFALEKPEIFGLLGPSGAGKTTLVKIISGIEEATNGETRVLGTNMPNLQQMKKIGYMAQSDALYSELTAKENIMFFSALYGLKKSEIKRRIQEIIAMVDLEQDMNKKVADFSGGMKRRLSLAIALIHEPKILILDEPTVGIDPVLRRKIWGNFQELKASGTTIIVTTHVMDEAEKCDRLGMIRDGEMIAIGSPDHLKSETQTESIEDAFLYYGGVLHAN